MVTYARGQTPATGRADKPRDGMGRPVARGIVSLVIVIALLVGGCLDIRVRMGNRPDTDRLEGSLRLGESTTVDVVAALGQPSGQGRVMLPIDRQPRVMWSYYYAEGDMKDSRQEFLFVLFDQDRYAGYMWFSSLPR
jgi:hypothetical protein